MNRAALIGICVCGCWVLGWFVMPPLAECAAVIITSWGYYFG